MTSTIIDFWKSNPTYWITHPSKQKEVDKLIKKQFWNYDWTQDNIIGQIIYLDQFSRHFARIGLLTENEVEKYRKIACSIINNHLDYLLDFDETEIIFALMPFKHLKRYDFIFEYLHNTWLRDKKIIDFPNLQRFYIDTYKKTFTLDRIQKDIIDTHTLNEYDPFLICDYYPPIYASPDWKLEIEKEDELLHLMKKYNQITVSLSGGVDSMVMLSILKHVGADVNAVHVVYGNRKESEHEYRFLAEFCNKIGVKLYVYRIKWLRRGEIDRVFYEDMTRQLRFGVYHACSEGTPNILLGHIKDDIVENIWSNIAHSHHLDNLKKMEDEEIQHGVRIMRPFLKIDKSLIYTLSQDIGIPYLKNTTPSWSNRGKFREHFHQATINQFGSQIDNKVIEFAEAIQHQNKLLNILLYDTIYNSFNENKINITNAVKIKLDENGWLKIFEYICHKRYEISRPSIKCIRDFIQRLYKPWDKLNFVMGKHFKVQIISTKDNQYIMEFILI
jgi:tRNA(Ile)-lysidine synthetase-like protein